MIGLNFKAAKKVDVEGQLSKFLSLKFPKPEADKHESSIASFASLRNAATDATSASEASSESLKQYYVQIPCAASKFPLSESGGTAGAQLGFTWSDSFLPGSNYTQHSWTYEKASVLFNIAALYSQLAGGDQSTVSGKEVARNAYSRAAGILAFLQTKVTPRLSTTELPFDLSQNGLIFLQNLMLAQAQSLYYAVARERKMKAETLARIAAHAADLYRQAARELQATGDVSIQIEGIWPWRAHCDSSASLWDAASYMQFANKVRTDAEATGEGYGEEIAWLRACEAACKEAANIPSRSIYNSKHTASGTNVDTSRARELMKEIQSRLAQAVKDNAKVYFQPVPTFNPPPTIPRAALAKVVPFEDTTRESLYSLVFSGDLLPVTAKPADFEVPRDIFAGILPLELAKSVSLLEERLQVLIGEWKERADRVIAEGKATITDLGLPGSLDMNNESSPSGLPTHIWEKVKKMQLEGGVRELQRLHNLHLDTMKSIKETLQVARDELEDERLTDQRNREVWGARWTPAPSESLSEHIHKSIVHYTNAAAEAQTTDSVIAERLADKSEIMARLDRPKSDLDQLIPAVHAPSAGSSPINDATSSVRAEIRTVLDKLQTAMSAIPRLLASASTGFDRQEAQKVLSNTPTAEHNTVIDGLLQTPWSALKELEANLQSQAPLRDSLRSLYSRYRELCEQDERIVQREAAIEKILQTVNHFEVIHDHLKEGSIFWKKLKGYVDTVLTGVRDFTMARRLESREILLAIQTEEGGAAPNTLQASQGVRPNAISPIQTANSLNNTAQSIPSGFGTASPTPSLAGSFNSISPKVPSMVSTNPFDEFSRDVAHSLPSISAPAFPPFDFSAQSRNQQANHTPTVTHDPPHSIPQSGYALSSQPKAIAIPAEAAAAVECLRPYGFDWEDLQRALKTNNGDYNAAVNSLIGGN